MVQQSLRIVMRFWFAVRLRRLVGTPRPIDSRRSTAAGPDSDHLLIFGSGPALSFGVSISELGLSGNLSRALARRTGRGAAVDVLADARISITTATRAFEGTQTWLYDGILVVLGADDAARLTPAAVWRRELSGFLRAAEESSTETTHVFVLGINDLSGVGSFSGGLSRFADRHARTLNALSAAVVADHQRTSFIPFSPATSDVGNHRTSMEYLEWAEMIAENVAPRLNEQHAGLPALDARNPDVPNG